MATAGAGPPSAAFHQLREIPPAKGDVTPGVAELVPVVAQGGTAVRLPGSHAWLSPPAAARRQRQSHHAGSLLWRCGRTPGPAALCEWQAPLCGCLVLRWLCPPGQPGHVDRSYL